MKFFHYYLSSLYCITLSVIGQLFQSLLGLIVTRLTESLPLLRPLSLGAELVDTVGCSHNKHFSK